MLDREDIETTLRRCVDHEHPSPGPRTRRPPRQGSTAQVRDALLAYVQHTSPLCADADGYPQDGDCPCGLLATLDGLGIDPAPWVVPVQDQQEIRPMPEPFRTVNLDRGFG